MSPESSNQQICGFSTAGRIFFGWGATTVLRDVAREFGGRVFVCTDQNMVKAGVVEIVLRELAEGKAEVKVFDGGQPEVDRHTIERAADVAQAYAPDVVIGLGGGSNLDLSKAVALLVKYPGPLSAYYGENNIPGPITPVVAVPTTAGTGSEVSPVAVVADPERAMKVGIASRALIPKWAIVDPALTVSCPASVTAHSGMDALAHAIESFCAKLRTDSCRAYAQRKATTTRKTTRVRVRADAGRCFAISSSPGHLTRLSYCTISPVQEVVMCGHHRVGRTHSLAQP